MINKKIIEQPKPLTPYFVEHNDTGEREVCELVRGVWQRVNGTPLFFAYENDAVATHEAHICEECGKWAAFPGKYGDSEYCENCVPF